METAGSKEGEDTGGGIVGGMNLENGLNREGRRQLERKNNEDASKAQMGLKKQADVKGPDGQQLGRSSRLDGPRTGEGKKSAGLTVLNVETEHKLGHGLEHEKAQPKQQSRSKNTMHESVTSQQANVNKGKEKVEGDRDRMKHGRTSSNRKENLTKLPQKVNMHVTTSNGSEFRGSTSLVQKPMERNREPEPPDEDVLMDEGHVIVANGTNGEDMEGIETPVGVILLEEREVRKDNP